MNSFLLYAKYYDLFYKDKDYSREVIYVDSLIQKFQPNASKILDLGCGTGRHVFEFAKRGYEITGVDFSSQMIAQANKELTILKDRKPKVQFLVGDARTIRLNDKFDVITALFHVMSYQLSNDDVRNVLLTAKDHLKPGGVFIFDYWYGPAVLTDRPEVRIKRIKLDKKEAIRIATPELKEDKNCVYVDYLIIIKDSSNNYVDEVREQHKMRYFFQPELLNFFDQAELKPMACYEWLTDNPPGFDSWYVVHVLRKDEK